MTDEPDVVEIPGAAEAGDDKPISYVAQLPDGSLHTPKKDDAYVLVRVTEPQWPNGSVTVYLPDGTALVVPGKDLIRLSPARLRPGERRCTG